MIYAIDIATYYGRQYPTGIQRQIEWDSRESTKYAYSLDQALSWVKSIGFDGIKPIDLHDGRFLIDTEWVKLDRNDLVTLMTVPDDLTHTMTSVILSPVSTIYEDRKREIAVYSLE